MTVNNHTSEILRIIEKHVSQYESDDLLDMSSNKGKPFLKHVSYFADNNGDISRRSIGTKWKKLSNELFALTYIKGAITISGANAVRELNIKSSSKSSTGCPFIESFKTEQIMPLLKHTNDTGIVNKDGSINRKALENFCVKYFEFSEKLNTYILPESSMKKYLKECLDRDKLLIQSFRWYLPSTSVVANAEWNDFYLNFSNCTKDNERAVTLDVFCEFYYFGDKLYAKVLASHYDDKAKSIKPNSANSSIQDIRINKKARLIR